MKYPTLIPTLSLAPTLAPTLASTLALCLGTLLFPALSVQAQAQVVRSAPLGFNKITCLVNSDTIVGVPFRREGSIQTRTTGAPLDVGGQPDQKEIPLGSLALTPGALTQHYLLFASGTRDGRWYDIVANSETSVTIDLNGDNVDTVALGDSAVIAEYWTLNTLFPPAAATTSWTEEPAGSGNWVPNGHAIVASLGTRAFQRRTELLFPDFSGSGINRSSSVTYYIFNNTWQQLNGDGSDMGNVILYPDYRATIRHPASVSFPTEYSSSGEVLISSFSIPLHTQVDGPRDTYIALPRPVDLTLSALNLWESGAFVQSLGTRAFQRRDELLVFDNNTSVINKSSSATYFHDGTNWLAVGDNVTNRDNDVIPAGAGFVIRKYQTTAGETVFWNNTAPY